MLLENMINTIHQNGYSDKVMIWSACEKTDEIFALLKEHQIEICGYIDREYQSKKEYNGLTVFDKSILKEKGYFVYIGLENTYPEVLDFMRKSAYEEFKDYWYPAREIILDGSTDWHDDYGNIYHSEAENHFSLKLQGGSRCEIGKDSVIKETVTIEVRGASVCRIGRNNRLEESVEVKALYASDIEIGDSNAFWKECRVASWDKSRLFIKNENIFQKECVCESSHGGRVEIESECHFGNRIFITSGGSLSIGSGLAVGRDSILGADYKHSLTIGEHCIFSWSVFILSGNGHNLFAMNENINLNQKAKNIMIKEHVWLGMRAALVSGAEIGSGSMVGAQSLVNKKFPNNSLIVGNPARIIRDKIAWRPENMPLYDTYEDFKEFDYTTCGSGRKLR